MVCGSHRRRGSMWRIYRRIIRGIRTLFFMGRFFFLSSGLLAFGIVIWHYTYSFPLSLLLHCYFYRVLLDTTSHIYVVLSLSLSCPTIRSHEPRNDPSSAPSPLNHRILNHRMFFPIRSRYHFASQSYHTKDKCHLTRTAPFQE